LEVSVTPAAHLLKAQSFLNSGYAGSAIAECDAALRAEPNNEEAKKTRAAAVSMSVQQSVNTAQSLFDQRQYDQAISECDRALALDSQNQQAITLKARIQETKRLLGYQ
jgi:tetratricopeptide (TPR) repeat protein